MNAGRGSRALARAAALAAALGAAGFALPASSDVPVFEQDGFALNLNLTAAFGVFDVDNANFGAGAAAGGGSTNRNVEWIDGFLRPGASFSLDTEEAGELYGRFAYVLSATHGREAALLLNPDDPKSAYTGELALGWRSGNLLPALGEDGLDLSFGRQPYQVADGFILWDGTLNAFEKSSWWLNAEKSFERAGIVRLNTRPVHGEGFFIETDENFGSTEAFGANVEADREGVGTVGGMVMHFTDANAPTRDGMDLFDLRANGTPIPAVPDFSLWGEFVWQTNGGRGEKDATAWYVEPGYAFPGLPWTPRLAYRYVEFSGDDPTTTGSEGYDYLFYGFGRGWGTWVQGEVLGEYVLFNTNVDVHVGHLTTTLFAGFDLHLLYYRFFLDEPASFAGNAGRARDADFADEVDLALFWTPTDYLTLYGAAGVAIPGDGAREAFGENENFYVLEAAAYVSF